jgi:5-methylcytosine-specific restriction endonuclease McrA
MDTTEHMCKRCGAKSATKSSLVRHLHSKHTCPASLSNVDRADLLKELTTREYKTNTTTCEFCKKTVSKPVYQRHLKTCKANKECNTTENEVVSTSKTVSLKLFLELKEQVDKLSQQLTSQNIQVSQVSKHVKSALTNLIEQEVKTCIQQMVRQHTTNVDNNNEQLNEKMSDVQTDAPSPPVAIRRRQKINGSKRRLVWKTYIGMAHGEVPCLCCKSNNIDMLNFHCGHVVSDAEGGNTELSNLRPICSVCNSSMGSMNMKVFAKEEFGVEIA